MKKGLQLTFSVFCLLGALSAFYYYLLPETSNSHAETKVFDSAETKKYQQDVLEEHSRLTDKKIAEELKSIYEAEQMDLMIITEAIKMYGSESREVQNLIEVKEIRDEAHLKKVTEIVDKYGWLGEERIGALSNYTLFATIQNADLDTQDKYIPIMKKAVASGTLEAQNFANLVDRKALVQHQKQVYGTVLIENKKEHSYSFAPIVEENTVNERRKEIGLPSIEAYAREKGIKYRES